MNIPSLVSTCEELCGVLEAEYNSLNALVYLLKEEQKIILQRQTDQLRDLIIKLEEQLRFVHQSQRERNALLELLLPDAPQPAQSGLASRTAELPETIRQRPLSIAQKIDIQLLLVHEFAWQNHVLLSHSIQFLNEVLSPWLDPQNQNVTLYGQHGTVHKNVKNPALYQAVA